MLPYECPNPDCNPNTNPNPTNPNRNNKMTQTLTKHAIHPQHHSFNTNVTSFALQLVRSGDWL